MILIYYWCISCCKMCNSGLIKSRTHSLFSLLLDVSSSISTSRSTRTPSAFDVICHWRSVRITWSLLMRQMLLILLGLCTAGAFVWGVSRGSVHTWQWRHLDHHSLNTLSSRTSQDATPLRRRSRQVGSWLSRFWFRFRLDGLGAAWRLKVTVQSSVRW